MKVSASIYSSNNKELGDLISELEKYNIDYIHIDCNDNMEVFEDIGVIRKLTNIPIDLHIISSFPSKFYNAIIDNSVELVTFQHECLKENIILPNELKQKCKIGIAFTTETDVNTFKQYEEIADFVLIMATTPGKSGGKFSVENFAKIRKFHKLYNNKKIHVDGGVNAEISFILRNLGVYSVVSGSYLVNSNDIFKALFDLKYGVTRECTVSSFMISLEDCPIIYDGNISLQKIIECVVKNELGFCIVLDECNIMKGIITSGDILRYFLHTDDFKDFNKMDDLINTSPLCVKNYDSVLDMIKLIQTTQKSLSFIPVVNDNSELKGVVSFKELIKGGI
ncbi:CBS domain-containing protein [Campylobacter lari]|nr:CBS domain-containing protein [Campylobacter lari]EAK5847433.1 CBS domain-containing protein [Campylobacter lari]